MTLAPPAHVPRPRDITAANQETLTALTLYTAEHRSIHRYAVTGSRTWTDRAMLAWALWSLPATARQLNGMAEAGADLLARDFWGEHLGRTVVEFPARWEALGKRAGFVRNQLMMEVMPDLVLAFVDHSVLSNGTRQAIAEARTRSIRVFVFHQGE